MSTLTTAAELRPYTTNLGSRTRVISTLGALSVVLAVFVSVPAESLLDELVTSPVLGVFVGPPSMALIFAGMYRAYDRVLWRKSVFGLRLSRIPDLNGTWTGHVTLQSERRDEEAPKVPCHAYIEQTWSAVLLDFRTEFSTSSLTMASIDRDAQFEAGFRYQFCVRPRPGSQQERDGMGIHVGTAHLKWYDNPVTTLDGDFYSGQGYQRYGEYTLTRTESPLSGPQWLERMSAAPSG